MKNIGFAVLILIPFLGGCAYPVRTDSTPYSSGYTPRRSADQIQVFSTSLPSEPYIEVGLIQIEARRRNTLTEILNAIRSSAAEQGADAVILQETSESTRAMVPVGNIMVTVKRKTITATAIRFKEVP
jgi:hypothetical protein